MTVNLTLSEVGAFKSELLCLLEQLRAEISDEMVQQPKKSIGASEVHDAGEEANATVDLMLNVESLARHSDELSECLSALERIEQGDFGSCIDCAEEIELSRLRACPTAPRCIRCQSTYEAFLQKSA